MLCEKHNHDLSQLDEEAGRLIETIGLYDRGFNQKNPRPETTAIRGCLIERWMLKTTCGMVAAGYLAQGGVRLEVEIPAIWVSILTEAAQWPNDWGLYVAVPTDSLYHSSSFSLLPMSHPTTGDIVSVVMTLNGVMLSLLLGRIDNPSTLGTYRPKELVFEQRGIEKVVEISWPYPTLNHQIRFTRIGTYEGPPPRY